MHYILLHISLKNQVIAIKPRIPRKNSENTLNLFLLSAGLFAWSYRNLNEYQFGTYARSLVCFAIRDCMAHA